MGKLYWANSNGFAGSEISYKSSVSGTVVTVTKLIPASRFLDKSMPANPSALGKLLWVATTGLMLGTASKSKLDSNKAAALRFCQSLSPSPNSKLRPMLVPNGAAVSWKKEVEAKVFMVASAGRRMARKRAEVFWLSRRI
ncbi:MAG: hypothetical protein E6K60_12160 [Nitrospirae bacterium]|nr:MAG: hypothetical protein E6K60_12160 [Nitrospirota bacterium]